MEKNGLHRLEMRDPLEKIGIIGRTYIGATMMRGSNPFMDGGSRSAVGYPIKTVLQYSSHQIIGKEQWRFVPLGPPDGCPAAIASRALWCREA